MKRKLTGQLLVFLFLFLNCLVQGQNQDAAELIREGNHLIFKNPMKAKEIAQKLYDEAADNNPQKIDALLIMAQADALLVKYDSSLQYALQAKSLSENMSDESYKLRVYSYLGYHYYRLNIKDKAWFYIDDAEKIIQNYPIADSLSYLKGNIFFTKGSMYQTELDCAYAINYYSQAIKAYSQSIDNEYSNANLGLAYSQKGYCEIELNKLQEAEKSFGLAISNSEQNHDIRNNIFARVGVARVSAVKGDYAKSNEILHHQLSISDSVNLKHLQSDIYKFLSYNYLKLKDTNNYELYDSLYRKSQSEFNETEAGSINHIINDAAENQKEKKSGSDFLIIGIIVIIILLCSILFFILKAQKMKKRMKNTEREKSAKN